jgi:hypothetical protein
MPDFTVTLQAQILSLRSSVDGQLTPGLDVRQPPTPEARWAPGDRMSARVEAALPGGRFHVRVDDLLLEMQLPEGFEPGDRLELEFVGAQPRPSFLLRTPPDGSGRQEVQLSPSGRTLADLVKSVVPERAANPTAATPTAVKEAVPLLAAPTTDAARLAQALSGALDRSGLFYESHQAQWVAGQRPLDALLNEPQGRLPPLPAGPEDLTARANQAASLPATSRPEESNPTALAASPPDVQEESKAAPAPVHPQALPQVRSQLDALETHQLAWQGQLWPGQQLEWRIGEPGEEGGESGEPQPWFTQLRLRLPRLGELTADLALVGSAVRVRLATQNDATQTAMSQGRPVLAGSLSAAGLDLISFKVVGADGGD